MSVIQRKSGNTTMFTAFADYGRAVETAKLDAMQTAFETWVEETEAQMQRDAEWTDRTGNARRGLVAIITDSGRFGGMAVFEHSEVYGKYLEFAFGGRYAVFYPTLAQRLPVLYATFQRVWAGA